MGMARPYVFAFVVIGPACVLAGCFPDYQVGDGTSNGGDGGGAGDGAGTSDGGDATTDGGGNGDVSRPVMAVTEARSTLLHRSSCRSDRSSSPIRPVRR